MSRLRGSYLWVFGLLGWFLLGVGAAKGGFFFDLPPHYTAVSSAKRNHVFYVGEVPSFDLAQAAARYEVRDYYGTLIRQGVPSGDGRKILLPRLVRPGWYQLYVYGAEDQGEPWGTVVGGTTFVIFRHNSNFPELPAASADLGAIVSGDEVMRGVTGIGPQRFSVDDASKPDEAIAKLSQDIAVAKAFYLSDDPVRGRALMIAFPNGVGSSEGPAIAGVRKIVAQFKNDVRYWEGKNEPDGSGWSPEYAAAEQRLFYAAVKGVDSSLKVLGPAVVTLKNPVWLDAFLTLATGSLDAFSFHAYNAVNGDLWLARQSLTDLKALLQTHGLGEIEIWQTEQGYFAAVYGSYQPRLQGRWTMLQMMVYEQYGIPKEHNFYFYDKSHGFWDFPTFFENEDGGLNPAAALMRVWSEELYGTTHSRAYSFGAAEQNMYVGSLFSGSGRSVAAFMAAGTPSGAITLAVTGKTLKTVSAFGAIITHRVRRGRVRLPVTELPTYVELRRGQRCEVVPQSYGENLARQEGVEVLVNDVPDPTAAKLVNGALENWYYTLSEASAPWQLLPTQWPVTVEVRLPATEWVTGANLFAAVPWQSDATPVDYEIQSWNGRRWVTLQRVIEPLKTEKVFIPAVRCTVASYFSDRCIFEHRFRPVRTDRLRLQINNVTFGGGATADVLAAGGQPGFQRVVLREFEIYGRR